jgi:hypothetical protein
MVLNSPIVMTINLTFDASCHHDLHHHNRRRSSMKTFCTLTLALCLTLPVFSQDPANFLEGSWEMLSRKQVYPDTTIDLGRFPGPSYKILNSSHFAFGRQVIKAGQVEDDVFAGGGRYELVGDSVYTEYIEYHSEAPLVGQSITFNCKVIGDLWYHSGMLGNYVLEEVWRRVR